MRGSIFFSLIVCCVSSHAQLSDVKASFLALNPEPQVIYLKKNHLKIPAGGHLQGIQALSDSQIIVTASSGSYAYFLTATSGEFTSIRNLSIKPFRHAGGFQICDSIMVVGIEDNIAKDKSHIIRFLFDDLAHIIDVGFIASRSGSFKRSTAGAVGLSRAVTGQYLLAVGDWNSRNIDFYLSRPGEDKWFDSLTTFHVSDTTKWYSYQSLNLLTDTSGKKYLIGFALDGLNNRADLYEVDLTTLTQLKLISTRNFHCKGGAGFRYGSGINIKEGQLCIYSIARNVTARTAVNIFR